MRIRFFRPTSELETGSFLALGRRIDAFWAEVAEAVAPLAPGSVLQARDRFQEAVERVADGLLVEVLRDGTLVVSSALDGAGALADAVVARAPASVGVGVVRYRPRDSPTAVHAEVQRTHGVDLSGAVVRCGVARGHLAEVVVYSSEFSDARDPRALDAANLAVLSLVGEERFDHWVGAVDVAPLPRPSVLRVLPREPEPDRFEIDAIASVVDRVVDGVMGEVGSVPCHAYCEHARWTMLELEPEGSEDYVAQDDLVHVVTMLPEMTKSFLSGARFASARFSSVGERFAYVKLDVHHLDVDARQQLRLRLEDDLNYALVPGRVGCVVAAGLGRRYLYTTLALADVDHGVELARRVAARAYDRERGWILFCDTDWAREWVGMHDASPAPPGHAL